VPTWDAKAHLVKCAGHGFASCFRQLIDLTEADSARFVSGELIDGSSYSARPRRGLDSEYCTFTRQAFHAIDRSSVFDSPALGLRLFSGGGA
jgi:hypothetical protein